MLVSGTGFTNRIKIEASALTGVLLALVGGHEVGVADEEVEIQLVPRLCVNNASFVMNKQQAADLTKLGLLQDVLTLQ